MREYDIRNKTPPFPPPHAGEGRVGAHGVRTIMKENGWQGGADAPHPTLAGLAGRGKDPRSAG